MSLAIIEAIVKKPMSTVVSIVGSHLIIQGIITTTGSIYNLITYLGSNKQVEIIKITNQIEKIDLEFTIKIIEQLVKEYETVDVPKSIHITLASINTILSSIHSELTELETSIRDHKVKYFSKWRTFTTEFKIETLISHNNILKNRYKMLFELLKIYPESQNK